MPMLFSDGELKIDRRAHFAFEGQSTYLVEHLALNDAGEEDGQLLETLEEEQEDEAADSALDGSAPNSATQLSP